MNFKELNIIFSSQSYVQGFLLSQEDFQLYDKISKLNIPKELVHLSRWFYHISSFSLDERKLLFNTNVNYIDINTNSEIEVGF